MFSILLIGIGFFIGIWFTKTRAYTWTRKWFGKDEVK